MKASILAATLFFLLPAITMAQATRTWVSGVGDDVNPCSRTAPCKTWAGAIAKTAAGGEINALDSGGFGSVTITKPITIDGASAFASTLAAGVNGITITAVGNVTLRNISIQGVSTGLSAIKHMGRGSLHVENVQVRNFGAASSPSIDLSPTGGSLDALLLDVVVENCAASTGISLNGATNTVRANLSRVTVANCGTALLATGAGATARVSDSTLLDDNVAGCSAAASGTIISYGNNRLAASCAVTSASLR